MTEVKYNLGDGEIIAEYDEYGIAKITRECFEEYIKKQIPKKPIIVHPLQENDSSEFACPICKTGALVKRIDKFCWSCGQAIKWE